MTTEDTTNTDASASAADSSFDWPSITGSITPQAAAAAPMNLPPLPPNTALIVGRLPIGCDTGVAIVHLPKPIKNVHCASVTATTGVLSDCYRPAADKCVPNAKRAQPMTDRKIKVFLDGGGGMVEGLGWEPAGDYPGALLKTRSVDVGVPYVDVWVLVGVDCGCASEEWASDEWGQP